jgi:hypothetical protein
VECSAEPSALAVKEIDARFELSAEQQHGASPAGIPEEFPLEGARTTYGSTKLVAELVSLLEATALCAAIKSNEAVSPPTSSEAGAARCS